ncbi:MAG TPA: histidine kinase dimerization/phospho-acceptor domain-containing protein, partial [Candidatus Baltobacteraceae bacterium]|nr:histidine kinase dimerization/phospho-acceptor domain-containing protein [Candidatus Baltobacteraceae bacterium]
SLSYHNGLLENFTLRFQRILRKSDISLLACEMLFGSDMSSFDSIYKKLTSSLEQGGAGHAHKTEFDPARHIAPVVAHELNNILTIIQGYADRLLLKHGKDVALEPHLKLISEAARRATTIVRSSVPGNGATNSATQSQPTSQPPRPTTT